MLQSHHRHVDLVWHAAIDVVRLKDGGAVEALPVVHDESKPVREMALVPRKGAPRLQRVDHFVWHRHRGLLEAIAQRFPRGVGVDVNDAFSTAGEGLGVEAVAAD